MTRKDTILIAVVINAGLLSILFTTAVIYDADKAIESSDFVTTLADGKGSSGEKESALIAINSTGDEVDNVLKYYSNPQSGSQPYEVETQNEVYVTEPGHSSASDEEEPLPGIAERDQSSPREVIVKKGDMLEKIARANGTTVSAIKKANNLENERLSIGQVLKIPAKKSSASTTIANASPATQAAPQPTSNREESQGTDTSEPVYHVVKSGDNPWKIAKQYGVKYDDIIRLNHLDEEKARNLKPGDRIRVK